jgi:multicomponent Na+:H+ antiporter subunit C
MLTAIVVGVATIGVALALLIRVYQGYGTLDEDALREKMK